MTCPICHGYHEAPCPQAQRELARARRELRRLREWKPMLIPEWYASHRAKMLTLARNMRAAQGKGA